VSVIAPATTISDGDPAPTAGPLAHLRVVDLTDLRGALAGRIFADLGADVVRIEPRGGDGGRGTPPFVAGGASLPFLFRNLGKRGVVLDLDGAGGRARLAELCDAADVLVENVDGPAPLRAQLAAVRERHPHLVHVTIGDLGRSGPRAGWRLEPLPAFAASGALWASGFPDLPPCWLPGYQAHDCASILAVTGALGVLLARAGGRTVEVSVQEAALASFAPWGIVLAEYAARLPILPARYPRDADGPALVLPVADGWVRLLAVTPRQLRALAALVGGREPSPHESASQEPAPHENREWPPGLIGSAVERTLSTVVHEGVTLASGLVRALSHLPLHADLLPAMHAALAAFRLVATRGLAGRRRDDVVAHGCRLGLPIAPVHRPEEFVAAEQTRVRGYFRRTGFPHLGDAPVAPFPCVFSRTPVDLRRPAPAPDEDGPGFEPRQPSAVRAAAPPPLAGMRVVSLGVGAVVPELCCMLADLGAEVVKIESATSPDFLRRLSLDLASPNRSFMFNDENRGQQSVCLNLGAERGRELALRLCATADVVAENRQGGLVERLGLGYDAVRAERPNVVYVSSQGYGRGGPLGTAPAYGPLAAAFAGVTWLWNHAGARYPAGSSLEHPDHLAGKILAIAVLAALEHRRRTGEGQSIELAQSEAAAFLVGDVYLQETCAGRPAVQSGNASPYACPHGVYPSRGDDAWIAIAVPDDAAWERFCAAVHWPADPRLARAADRLHARAEIDARVAVWTRTRSAADAAAVLQEGGVSAFPVESPEGQRVDPHLRARAALVPVDDPEVGAVLHVRNPLRFDGVPLASSRPAPALGADTEDVLVRVLGLTPAAVRRLADEGVCT
jgi:crotonobetainyl-CoA:carnitine CoA-transferase CaiB-like acyl-CoA transferase